MRFSTCYLRMIWGRIDLGSVLLLFYFLLPAVSEPAISAIAPWSHLTENVDLIILFNLCSLQVNKEDFWVTKKRECSS
jgi:hypothetical protein